MKKIFLIICAVCALSGCDKWLDVNPRSEVRAEELFKNEEGFYDALTGLYIGMTDRAAYGGYLSWEAIEFMAWNHTNTLDKSPWFSLQRNDYNAQIAQSFTMAVWGKLYNVIAEANYLLWAVDEYGGFLDPHVRETIKGEALAIRAYCHFDLMRLYAPVPNASNLSRNTIPYVTKYEKHVPVQRTYSATLKMLTDDIDEAARLLDERAMPEDERIMKSNTHFSWAAAKLLRLRVAQWMGDANTLSMAKEFIAWHDAGVSKWQMDVGLAGADKQLPSEVLLGLNVWDLKKFTEFSWRLYIGSGNGAQNDNMLRSVDTDQVLNGLFQRNALPLGTPNSDIRFSRWFTLFSDPQLAQQVYLSEKVNCLLLSDNAASIVPLVRISEAWLIAAEASPREQAIEFVNILRSKRGLSPDAWLPADTPEADVKSVIEHEYRREFTQEGQTFFLYKRLNKVRMPGMPPSQPDMTAAKYVLPYPESEVEFGINQ